MSNINTYVRRSQQVLSDNAPAVLTGLGVAGTIFTTVIAARAGYKAGYKVALDEATGGTPEETPRERQTRIAKSTWKLYLPTAVTGVATIASISMANRIGTSRMAALAAAYTISDKAFVEYKNKVTEMVGEKKATEVQDKIMHDRINRPDQPQGNLIVLGGNDVLCYDAYTDRYFQSTMEKIKKAQNDTNYEIMNNMYVSLSEFYSRLGLPPTGFSDDVGWNGDNKLELHFSSVMTPDERPALAFSFHVTPIRNYYKAPHA